MGRFRLLGLCLLLTMAFAACAMSAAASGADYKWCRPQKKGDYVNSSCTTKSAHPHKGKYERLAGPVITDNPGMAKLITPALSADAVECSASTTAGNLVSPKVGIERVTLTGCEYQSMPCESTGPNGTPSGQAGVIETNLLNNVLIGYPETRTWENTSNQIVTAGPATGEAWTVLSSSEHEPIMFEIECGGTAIFRFSGEIGGPITPVNVLTSMTLQKFAPSPALGVQGMLGEAWSGSAWVGPDPSEETTEEELQYSPPITIVP